MPPNKKSSVVVVDPNFPSAGTGKDGYSFSVEVPARIPVTLAVFSFQLKLGNGHVASTLDLKQPRDRALVSAMELDENTGILYLQTTEQSSIGKGRVVKLSQTAWTFVV